MASPVVQVGGRQCGEPECLYTSIDILGEQSGECHCVPMGLSTTSSTRFGGSRVIMIKKRWGGRKTCIHAREWSAVFPGRLYSHLWRSMSYSYSSSYLLGLLLRNDIQKAQQSCQSLQNVHTASTQVASSYPSSKNSFPLHQSPIHSDSMASLSRWHPHITEKYTKNTQIGAAYYLFMC